MNYSKPKAVGPVRADCPVCGKTAYSRDGIHPQCAAERADKVVHDARKAAAGKAPPTPPRQQWTKVCPRCQRSVPARRAVCDCGHTFIAKTSA